MHRPLTPTPLHQIHHDALAHHEVRLLVKRDDLIHPAIPGNKWRKLTPNLEAARRAGHGIILTFGGAYSNHIYAVASAGQLFGFRTIGVIRGEEHLPLIAGTPGLRRTWVRETAQKLMGDDVLIVTGMEFDDRATLDAALVSDAMKAGGRNLREIAPGIVTLLVMEDATELEAAATPA